MRISDVAKILGVSTATISRVINRQSGVSEEVRRAIQEKLDEIGYHPNLLGRNLRRSSTKMILVFFPTLSNSFYAEVINAMQVEAAKCGFILLVCEQHRYFNRYIDMVKNRLVDGAVIFYSNMPSEELTALASTFPIIQSCERVIGAETSYVGIDDEQAGFDAAKLLLENGHQKIVYVAGDAESEHRRYLGMRRAFSEMGASASNIKVAAIKRDEITNQISIPFKLLSEIMKEFGPTAFFCSSDMLALQSIQWLEHNGFPVPRAVSVLGFDDQDIAKYFRPEITTISQDKVTIGKKSIELLVKKIMDINSPNEQCIAEHHIIMRGTVAQL